MDISGVDVALNTKVKAAGYFTPPETAEHYRVPLATVRYWKQINYGPRPVKVGAHLRYPIEEIDRFDAELREAAKARVAA